MLQIAAVCPVFLLLICTRAQAQDATETQGQTQTQDQSPGQEQPRSAGQGQGQGQGGSATPWRQVIRWENNGRRFSLLNSGAEYVPAGSQAQDTGPRVVLADSRQDARPRTARRPQGGNVRRQAPSRGSSETIRGQARHPFGFGQVPDNWRQTPGGTGGTGGTRFQTSTNTRFRQPSTGSSSSSSSSFSSSSYNGPPFQQYPFAQQPQQPQYPGVPYDPSLMDGPVRSYEPPFQPMVPGGGYGGGGYGGGAYGGGGGGGVGGGGGGGYTGTFGGGVGGVGGQGSPMGGAGSPVGQGPFTDYEDGYRFYQPYGYAPNPAARAPPPPPPPQQQPPQPPFADGLDRRYTHSLYNGETAAVVPEAPVPVGVDRTGTAAQSPVRSPQYEQFPPFGRPQPPFVQQVAPGRVSPNSAIENPGHTAGSVYRQEQRGTPALPLYCVRTLKVLTCLHHALYMSVI